MVDEDITASEFRQQARQLIQKYFTTTELKEGTDDSIYELALREDEITTFLEETNNAVEPEDRDDDPRFRPTAILRSVITQLRDRATPTTDVEEITGTRPADESQLRDRPQNRSFEYENIDARIFIGSSEYEVIKYKSTADISDSANFGEATIIAADETTNVEAPDYDKEFEMQVRVSLNVDAQDIPRNQQMYNQWITLFRGHITNFRSKSHDQWFVQFSDFSADIIYEHTSIQNTNVKQVTSVVEQLASSISGTPNNIIFSGFSDDPDEFLKVVGEDFEQEEIRTNVIAQTAEDREEEIGRVTGVINDDEQIDETLTEGQEPTDVISFEGGQPLDTKVKFTRERQKTADLLDELAALSNAFWWVDRNNNFIFGKPNTQVRTLQFVSDTDAGGKSPPYRSVVVIGDGVVGGDGTSDIDNLEKAGWGYDHLESNTTPVVTARIAGFNDDEPDIEPNEVQEPIFEYKNTDIKTPKQLKNTAIKLAEELAQQLEDGEITLVGRPDVRLLDQVEMPAYLTPSEEGFKYTVGGIKHRLNSQDGFVTKIEPMHTIGENNEIQEVRDALQIQTDEEVEQTSRAGVEERTGLTGQGEGFARNRDRDKLEGLFNPALDDIDEDDDEDDDDPKDNYLGPNTGSPSA